MVTELKIDDRMNKLQKQQALIAVKDHKGNFLNNPHYRLLNPVKIISVKSAMTSLKGHELNRKRSRNQPVAGNSGSHGMVYKHKKKE